MFPEARWRARQRIKGRKIIMKDTIVIGLSVALAACNSSDAASGKDTSASGTASPESDAAAEREIRSLFDAWWRASAAKDIDASMYPIASDVVSYEHVPPLEYVGVGKVREVCQSGFDAMPEQFRWDVPDLQVRVRGDLAVTWGLNHMQAHPPGKPELQLWSRGTRIFQKIDGRWQMIHQHVSFPYDPKTGAAKTDLKPEKPL
jgi:ketosteroid isomerase-like protein